MGLHGLPLLAVEALGLQQHAVGDADLADVVQDAGVAQEVRLLDAHAHRAAEPLAEPAHSLDVQAGLAVSRLRCLTEPAHDLELRLAQLLGTLAYPLL